ncbi:biotin/lipoyl-containing protein, partial [Nakamurella leprariae]
MSQSVTMPALGESVTEGTVTRWLKNVGDRVEADEPLLEVSTDKVDTEIPSPVAGVLERIIVGEDETVDIGAELAVIGDGSGGGADAGAEPEPEPEPQPEPETAPLPSDAGNAPEAPSPDTDVPAEKPTAGTGGSSGQGTPVTLPAMGESVTEGTVTRWLKAVGDEVAVDEPLLEVSTDKVDTEVPSPIAGVLLEISVGEDETVEVGGQLAVIGTPGSAPAAAPEPDPVAAQAEETQDSGTAPKDEPKQEQAAAPAPTPPAPAAAAPAQPAPAAAPAPSAPAVPSGGTTAYVTPVIRKLAADLGVDLSTVSGTGVGGRIRREDVQAAGEAAKAAASAPAAAPSAPAAAPAPPRAGGAGAPRAAARARSR